MMNKTREPIEWSELKEGDTLEVIAESNPPRGPVAGSLVVVTGVYANGVTTTTSDGDAWEFANLEDAERLAVERKSDRHDDTEPAAPEGAE